MTSVTYPNCPCCGSSSSSSPSASSSSIYEINPLSSSSSSSSGSVCSCETEGLTVDQGGCGCCSIQVSPCAPAWYKDRLAIGQLYPALTCMWTGDSDIRLGVTGSPGSYEGIGFTINRIDDYELVGGASTGVLVASTIGPGGTTPIFSYAPPSGYDWLDFCPGGSPVTLTKHTNIATDATTWALLPGTITATPTYWNWSVNPLYSPEDPEEPLCLYDFGTNPACGGFCEWEADSGDWEETFNNCVTGCMCDEGTRDAYTAYRQSISPAFPANGQILNIQCVSTT